MKLNSKNIFARYYNWIYGELPNDVCSFFWGAVFAIGLSVFLVPGKLTHSSKESVGKYLGSGIMFWIVYLVMLVVGHAVVTKFGYELIGFWGVFVLSAIIGAGVSIGALIVIFAPIVGGIYLNERVTESSKYESFTEKASDWIGAIRRKHCTKIDWE